MERAEELGAPLSSRIARSRIADLVNRDLEQSTFHWSRSGPRANTTFEVELGEFRILTALHAGGHGHCFGYTHSIKNKGMGNWNENMRFYRERLSICSWLGVSAETTWREIRGGEVEAVSRVLAHLCRHFLGAIGGLLDEKCPISN
jgi:hypothetical protein